MSKQRKFGAEFKPKVIQELLTGGSTPAQLTRRHEISSGLLSHWKKQYYKHLFSDTPNREAALQQRVTPLEQLVRKLTVENECLKKPCREASHQRRKTAVQRPPPAPAPVPQTGVPDD